MTKQHQHIKSVSGGRIWYYHCCCPQLVSPVHAPDNVDPVCVLGKPCACENRNCCAGGSSTSSRTTRTGQASGAASDMFLLKVKHLFSETRARLLALKESDPNLYAAELTKLRPRIKAYVETGELPDFTVFRPMWRGDDVKA